eukprot:Nk52_evm23s805 gene=Nk52_evmTU23s805
MPSLPESNTCLSEIKSVNVSSKPAVTSSGESEKGLVDMPMNKCTQGQDVLWKPLKRKPTPRPMEIFREAVNEKFNLKLEDYEELRKWSISHYSDFWEFFFTYSGIIHSKKWDKVIDTKLMIDDIPEWFSGCRMNYAENLLRYNDDRVALIQCGEAQTPKKLSFKGLREEVRKMAAALRIIGIQKDDFVVGYIPNCNEAIIAMLAASSIGAVWSSTSPDFGVTGVLERFSQVKPKVIFSVNAVQYNGKTHDHMAKLKSVVSGLPELKQVVVIDFAGSPASKEQLSEIPMSMSYNEFVKPTDEELTFEQLPFNHPMFVMYSSGTTGVPKCMVHSAGGTLIQHMKEHHLQGGLVRDDTLFYYSTTGWMMWNYLVAALAIGATVVCYDGSPFVPALDTLWDLVDELGITVFGTSAKWIATVQDKKRCPMKTHKLTSLRSILSTGSPLKPESFRFVYDSIKRDVLLGSITGGTDIISCFAGPCTSLPVVCGEIQAFNLGMDCHCFDETGNDVVDESGELVCLTPFPSMPVRFWNDPDGSKYRKAYFEKFPNVWAHGDYCMVSSKTGGIVMLGRSDGVLNPSGVRFGSAEIYNVIEHFDEIEDSLCVGQKIGDDERVVLFIMLPKNSECTMEDITKKVKTAIRKELSPRHVPALILPIADIPYTISGKKVEVSVKKIISGIPFKSNKGALRNPYSLDLYYNIPELAN